ncbi:hypothetical protein [Microbacterium rhizomatis]|uniref:Uncharacterized protein n=1 Tax=Microbacterium rhizomatis TaxID=1631477 RepID=A0A5J5J0J5_9MICO|nr:hypothetical protein [Microbacterium rhizomatis]KAA9107857.1 hypothetical protein F6B43_10510 [Microbacterium rhizomatis]
MAGIGGRSMWVAIPVGVLCLAAVGALGWLALPMMPAALGWVGSAVSGQLAAPAPSADPEPEDGVPTSCRGLYNDALWATLSLAPGSTLTPDASAPVTTATTLATALAPQVRFTCTWHGADGVSISTTVADVGTDAGAIAAASLPGEGFGCTDQGARVRCEKTTGDVLETLELGGGLWLSSTLTAWQPAQYSERVASLVWK